jgi:hypothetical protein
VCKYTCIFPQVNELKSDVACRSEWKIKTKYHVKGLSLAVPWFSTESRVGILKPSVSPGALFFFRIVSGDSLLIGCRAEFRSNGTGNSTVIRNTYARAVHLIQFGTQVGENISVYLPINFRVGEKRARQRRKNGR